MDIRQLESFLSVVDSPTMSRAAETLHLSTGSVSLQVRALSNELKVQLFSRSGRSALGWRRVSSRLPRYSSTAGGIHGSCCCWVFR